MTKPMRDKAEVAVEYPDELYIGTFAHTARFDAHLDQTGIALTLELPGSDDQRKSVHMHFHYALFAEILTDLAKTVAAFPADDFRHRESLRDSAKTLYQRSKATFTKSKDPLSGRPSIAPAGRRALERARTASAVWRVLQVTDQLNFARMFPPRQ